MIVNILLIILSVLLFFFNLDVQKEGLSTTSNSVLALEYVTTLVSAYFIIKTQLKEYSGKTKNRAFTYFLITFCFGLYWLAYNWTPYLHVGSGHWGFDAQRYYYYAIRTTMNENFVYNLNYRGIVDIYKFIMNVLGFDPLIPFFVNSLVFLFAVILLAKHISNRILHTNKFIHYFLMLIMIPELAYYNIMTSRELFCASFVIISIVYVDRFATEKKRWDLWKGILAFLFLTIIRPPFAFAVALAIGIWLMYNNKGKLSKYRTALMIGFLGIMLVGLFVSRSLGSVTDEGDLFDRASNSISGNVTETSIEGAYSESSISRLLIPHNTIEAIIFGFIRSFAYVVPEPRAVYAPWNVIIRIFNFKALGSGMPNLTAFIMLFFLRPVYREIRSLKKHSSSEAIYIYAFIVFFFVIGIFMAQFIHVRYRVVYDLLFFSIGIISKIRRKYKLKIE